MAKTDPINPNVPAGTEDPKLGNDRIQELARAVAEILNKDHYIGSDAGSGYTEDAAGEHNKITLRTGSAPTVEANKGYVYVKDVSGKAELFYKDEDSNEIQVTSGGILNSCNLTGNQSIAGTKTFASLKASANQDIGDYTLQLKQLIADIAQGTAPLIVTSNTKCTNLNADKVDGFDISEYTGAQSYTLPGGLILKMGYSTISSTAGNVTYDSAFPNAIVAVTTSIVRAAASLQTLNIYGVSTAGFSWLTGDSAADGFYWIAIGF